ncbi:MAG: hypothetical protein AMXMBFR84_42030 [Candidatus Hydrogenedentota bacterium]
MNHKVALADKLIALDAIDPALEGRYRREVNAMLERTLKPIERVALIAAAVFSFSTTVLFAVVMWRTWGELPAIASAGFAIGSVFGLAFGIISLGIFRKGRFNVGKDMGRYSGAVWIFTILMMTLFLVLGQQMENADKGTQLILVGLVFLVTFGVVGLLQFNIKQSELQIRESILRLEVHLAELTEQIRDSQSPAGKGEGSV